MDLGEVGVRFSGREHGCAFRIHAERREDVLAEVVAQALPGDAFEGQTGPVEVDLGATLVWGGWIGECC